MYLDVFSDNSFETNCWLLGAEGTDEAVVVDPGFSPERVRAMLETEGKRPVAALATHGHFDHTGSAAEFCGDDLPFYIHEADLGALTDPQGWGAGIRTPPVPVKDVRTVVDSDVLTFAGFEIEGKRPVAALATHGHFDHIGSAAEFCGDDLPFYIHEADVAALTDPQGWGAGIRTPPVPVKDVRTVVDGDVLTFAGFEIEVVHTPGHTPGSVCFRTDATLLSGDLVFAGAIGRSDFPNSSPADMERSLGRFLELPDRTDVLPGHGPRTTVGREREHNPFLQGR